MEERKTQKDDATEHNEIPNNLDGFGALQVNITPADHPEVFVPIPPDGGYGWMIVFSAFMISLIIDGITYSFAVLMSEFSEYFNCSKIEASLIGSVHLGTYLLSGPICSGAINQFGARPVAAFGSVLATLSFLLASQSGSIMTLLIFYSVFGGAAFGLVYLSAIIVVSQYFSKRRATALGLSSSGTGIGAFLMPPIINWLLDNYSLTGTLIVIAGILLNCLIFSILLRPLLPPELLMDDSKLQTETTVNLNDPQEEKREYSDDNLSSSSVPLSYSRYTVPVSVIGADRKKLYSHKSMDELCRLNSFLTPKDDALTTPIKSIQAKRKVSRNFSQIIDKIKLDGAAFSHKNSTAKSITDLRYIGSSVSCLGMNSDNFFLSVNTISRSSNKGRDQIILKLNRNQNQLRSSRKSSKIIPKIVLPQNVEMRDYTRPLYMKDIFYSRSVLNLYNRSPFNEHNQLTSAISRTRLNSQMMGSHVMSMLYIPVSPTIENNIVIESNESIGIPFPGAYHKGKKLYSKNPCRSFCNAIPFAKSALYALAEMTDISLLKNFNFLIYFISSVFLLGGLIPNYFLLELGVEYQIPEEKSALILSVMGITNMVARIIICLFADLHIFSSLFISNLSLFISGILSFFIPLFNNFLSICIYAAIYSFLFAPVNCLMSPLLCELVGIERLTNAFGLINLARGISAILGPPIGGYLNNKFGSLMASFMFCAVMNLFCSILCWLLYVPRLISDRQTEAKNTYDFINSQIISHSTSLIHSQAASISLMRLGERSDSNLDSRRIQLYEEDPDLANLILQYNKTLESMNQS